MTVEKPYFMENPNWYVSDDVYGYIALTNEAPKNAELSYEEYAKMMIDAGEWDKEGYKEFLAKNLMNLR